MITQKTTSVGADAGKHAAFGLTTTAEVVDAVNADVLTNLLGSTARLDIALYTGLTCRLCHTTLLSPHSSTCPLSGSHNQRPLDALIPGDQNTPLPAHIRESVERLTGHTFTQPTAKGNTPTARAHLRRWARRTTQQHPA